MQQFFTSMLIYRPLKSNIKKYINPAFMYYDNYVVGQ